MSKFNFKVTTDFLDVGNISVELDNDGVGTVLLRDSDGSTMAELVAALGALCDALGGRVDSITAQ